MLTSLLPERSESTATPDSMNPSSGYARLTFTHGKTENRPCEWSAETNILGEDDLTLEAGITITKSRLHTTGLALYREGVGSGRSCLFHELQ